MQAERAAVTHSTAEVTDDPLHLGRYTMWCCATASALL
eukprot:COSAG01_NODE_70835_length_257_cov_1.303797_1_plen_37_part_01